jgi:hypothetical protein
LTLALIFRKRLTRLGVRFQESGLDLEAERPSDPPSLLGKGVVIDDSKFKKSRVRVKNSTLKSRGTQVKGSSFDVSESSPQAPEATDD